MLIRLLVLVSISLLLASVSAASSDKTTKQNPADQLNQNDKPPSPSQDEDQKLTPSRAQLLYEHHCLRCHESNAHIRNTRKAKSIDDVRAWVTRWQAHEKLNWDNAAINAVATYLVKKYYKFK